MTLILEKISLGPLDNNSYLLADDRTLEAAVIDPSFDAHVLHEVAVSRKWKLVSIWITHAHFDHIVGVQEVLSLAQPGLTVALHPDDLPLWREGGGGQWFGIPVDPGPDPSLHLKHHQLLTLGDETLEVRHTPGHSPGHVIFYSSTAGVALCGDLILRRSVGRTDLPGSSIQKLVHSIRTQVYSLPPATQLLCGHGPETTVAEEIAENPFVAE